MGLIAFGYVRQPPPPLLPRGRQWQNHSPPREAYWKKMEELILILIQILILILTNTNANDY